MDCKDEEQERSNDGICCLLLFICSFPFTHSFGQYPSLVCAYAPLVYAYASLVCAYAPLVYAYASLVNLNASLVCAYAPLVYAYAPSVNLNKSLVNPNASCVNLNEYLAEGCGYYAEMQWLK